MDFSIFSTKLCEKELSYISANACWILFLACVCQKFWVPALSFFRSGKSRKIAIVNYRLNA